MSSRIYENSFKKFYKNFKGTIINIHPSLLPKYKGLNTHQRVLDNKKNILAVLYIMLIQNWTLGKLFYKKKVKIKKNETAKSLEKKY